MPPGMSGPALERTPFEIWSAICALLLHTPLLPHYDATFAQHMATFSYNCRSTSLRHELDQIAYRLRLVCRAWNEMVLKGRPKIVCCSLYPDYAEYLPTNILPGLLQANDMRPELLGADRLEIWIPLACHSEDNCRPSITQDA